MSFRPHKIDEFVIIEDGQEKTIGVECETNQNVF